MKGKRQFRGHVEAGPEVGYPRQDEIRDRRAFIASLGGVIVGSLLLPGCGDDGKGPATKGGKDSGPAPMDSGGIPIDMPAPVDKNPYLHDTMGLPDAPVAPGDASIGWPDMAPAPADLQGSMPDAPAYKDLGPAHKEMGFAGLPPPPDAGADVNKK